MVSWKRILSIVALLPILAPAAPAQQLTRVSVSSTGTEANGLSQAPEISRDGRFVVFISQATNLVSGDTNDNQDIFVHDRETGETTRVNVSSSGAQTDGHSNYPNISEDGRWVLFASTAKTLVASDTTADTDIFLHDRLTATTSIVAGGQGSASWCDLNADGTLAEVYTDAGLVAEDTNGLWDVYVVDLATGTPTLVSKGLTGNAEGGRFPSISRNGRYVGFTSFSSNIVSGDTNGLEDYFIHDLQTGSVERISIATDGTEANDHTRWLGRISEDGRWVFFGSYASNLVPGDTNGRIDVFLRDRVAGTTTRIALDDDGQEIPSGASLHDASDDGRFVLWTTSEPGILLGDDDEQPDLYLLDRDASSNGIFDEPGRTVLRRSFFTWDSRESGGWRFGGPHGASMSGDAKHIAFASPNPDLIVGDSNEAPDVFALSLLTLELNGTPSHPNQVSFTFSNASAAETGNRALVLISCSGAGGMKLLGERYLSLTADPCTSLGLSLSQFAIATLDNQGRGQTTPFTFPPVPAGLDVFAAGFTWNPATGALFSLSGALILTSQ